MAEKEWEAKRKRQSRSLDEAVEEYERRYKRAPPKGFDEWRVTPPYSSFAHLSKLRILGGFTANATTFSSQMNTTEYTMI